MSENTTVETAEASEQPQVTPARHRLVARKPQLFPLL